MTIKELIAELEKMPQDSIVLMESPRENWLVSDVRPHSADTVILGWEGDGGG